MNKKYQSMSSIEKITEDSLKFVAFKDAHRLRLRLREMKSREKNDALIQSDLTRWEKQVEQSIAACDARRSIIPSEICFPENLPVCEKREEIAALIKQHQVIVLAGETGSGKTTQLPKICLSLGRGVRGLIGHTQPRRIAAQTVATRIAEELESPLGQCVGYQVRFTEQANDNTSVKVMTDGILLAQIQNDPYLNNYDTIIIDEAHERSLNIDFLLGYFKRLLPKRPELKLIITSATIDVTRFSEHFDNAPVFQVSGRTYPVDVWYRPPYENNTDEDSSDDACQPIVDAIEEIIVYEKQQAQGNGGDILVFLSGEREIREAAKRLRDADFKHVEILPFYARLSLAEQTRVFTSHKGRRVVLATNVAETSITVPGIRYVIDTGVARMSRYSYRTKVQRLPIEAVSQASANQRKGRCGRVSNGICIRLYSEEDFSGRPEFTDAEILRTNLAAVILQMLQLNIGSINDFPFVDSPDKRLVNDGYKLLQELHGVNQKNKITPVGRRLARFNIDPKLARMLLAAEEFSCAEEALIIVSALSLQDPRERPADKKQAADTAHRKFLDEKSDFIAYVNLWRYLELQRQELSQGQFRKLCKKEFLSYVRVREWREIHRQLRLLCKKSGINFNSAGASFDDIHKALITGLLGNIGFHDTEREYLGARNRRFSIFPGSSQNKKRPKWLVSGELIETSQLFAHNVAKIEPEWVLQSAGHLVKRNHFEPHYDRKSGQVKAFEKVSLYGLTLIEKARVNYSQIDATVCREVFIRSGLVEGDYFYKGHKPNFFTHNQQLVKEMEALEAKSRRRDILVDDVVQFSFYDKRLPVDIVNKAGFDHWRKTEEVGNPKLLFMSRNDLMQHGASDITEAQFPNLLDWAGISYPLTYHFDPTHTEDGVSVSVPVSVLHQLPEQRLEWLVPGMLRDKCIGLIKGLPKAIRKNFVPVPDVVDTALAVMSPDNVSLTQALSHQLKRQTLVVIKDSDWNLNAIEDFYRFNIKVIGENNKILATGRDASELRAKYKEKVQSNISSAADNIERDEITQWDFDELSSTVQLKHNNIAIQAYPALIDKRQSVSLKVLDNDTEAHYLGTRGVCRLLLLNSMQTVKYLMKELMKGKELGLTVAHIGNREQVADDILMASARQICLPEGILPRTEAEFSEKLVSFKTEVVARASFLSELLTGILQQLVVIKKQIKAQKQMLPLALCVGDISKQINRLLQSEMVYKTPKEHFEQYPRYLNAIILRLEKAALNPQKDRVQMAECEMHEQRLWELLEVQGEYQLFESPLLTQYRWAIEELRVSLFAQTLKTAYPVSSKRLNKLWLEITL